MTLPSLETPAASLRNRLKQATSRQHAMLDRYWGGSGRFLSESAYRAFLHRLLLAHSQLGLPLAPTAALRGLEAERLEALRQDLRHDLLRLEGLALSPAPAPSVATSRCFGWGVAYVLNGSAMGASLMLKRGYLAPDWPRAYLTLGQSFAKSGALSRFFAQLETEVADPKDAEQGARVTFELLGNGLI